LIVRAQYSADEYIAVNLRNAELVNILRHIRQLGPILSSNADVIATVHAGFIGVWGEWWITTNEFGDGGVISPEQWANRKKVVDALLASIPAHRIVSVRTPWYKQALYGTKLVGLDEVIARKPRGRIGFHNDCFLADASDSGTFRTAAERSYTIAETRFLPMGGETCKVSDYSGWGTASLHLRLLRFTYLNIDFSGAVLASWGQRIDEAKRRLGYRLFVTHSHAPTKAAKDSVVRVNIGFGNTGYAAPMNDRPLEVVFRKLGTTQIIRRALKADVRAWLPEASIKVDQLISLYGLPTGVYDVGLALPDPAFTLRGRSDYAIRLAGATGWDAATGVNFIGHTIEIH
jgi:hypothetical protein